MNDLFLLLSVTLNVSALLVDKKGSADKSPWDCIVVGIILQFLIASAFVPFFDLVIPKSPIVWLTLLAVGVLTASARYLWFFALKGDQLSRLAPFRRLSTVFVLGLSLVFLEESMRLEKNQMWGAIIMVTGGFLCTFDRFYYSISHFFEWNRYVLCVLYFAAAIALMKTVNKAILDEYAISIFGVYFLVKTGQVIFVFPALFKKRRLSQYGSIALSHVLQMTGSLLYLFVIARQELSLSESIAAISPLMVIVLSRYFLGEKDSAYFWRMSSAGVMVVGYLVMKGFLWA